MASSDTGRPAIALSSFSRHNPPAGAVIRIRPEHLERTGGELLPGPAESLVREVSARLWAPGAPRFALLHNALPTFRSAVPGGSFQQALEWARVFRGALCTRVFARLCESFPEVLNPLGLELSPIEFDLDGYHVNRQFMGDDIDFRSNKQAHFDIVEPLGSNLYGPNVNIQGGFPAFADGRAYCQDHGIGITSILDKIPGSRNLTLKPLDYRILLTDYTVAYALDMVNDTPFTIFVNRVEEAGLLHGATAVRTQDPQHAAMRPISHFAWDNVTAEAADLWYRALGQSNQRVAGDPAGHKPLIPPSLHLAGGPPLITVGAY
jgi:hypothetical protein